MWFEPPPNRPGFEYHKDADEDRATRSTTQGWSTVGDMGYLDADGYLYLTDRRTFMIVSGGVNIYPQEAENLLIDHPKVYDVAVFGIPDAEMGEAGARRRAADRLGRRRPRARTRAARVLPASTSRTTSARRRSTSMRELPREQTGKLYKRLLRDRYWRATRRALFEHAVRAGAPGVQPSTGSVPSKPVTSARHTNRTGRSSIVAVVTDAPTGLRGTARASPQAAASRYSMRARTRSERRTS